MQQADITVKKADGTTNVVYVATAPSPGDKSPAVWLQNAASLIQGHRPRLEVKTQSNGSRTLRQVHVKFEFPHTFTDVNGLEKSTANVGVTLTAFLPLGAPTTVWKEASAQLANLLASLQVQSAFETGYAPT